MSERIRPSESFHMNHATRSEVSLLTNGGSYTSEQLREKPYMDYDRVLQHPDIELVSHVRRYLKLGVKCGEWLFWYHLHEQWATPIRPLPSPYDYLDFEGGKYEFLPYGFWSDPLEFLERKGFGTVTDPLLGDVIVYVNTNPKNHELLRGPQHFGVYQGDGSVVSKFGSGHVVRHPVWTVPKSYGDELLFLRKTLSTEN